MIKKDYLDEAQRQLNDATFYKALPIDPTPGYNRRVSEAIERVTKNGKIEEKIARDLILLHSGQIVFFSGKEIRI